MAIRFSRDADDDIVRLYCDSARLFGLNQADHYLAGFRAVCAILEANPKIARERSEYDPPVRIHPYKAHVIVYQIDADSILVIRVRHSREDWASDPSGS